LAKVTDKRMFRTVEKATKEKVTVKIPGSKSVTHRAFIISALAKGKSTILNPLDSEDTQITAQALRDMGVSVPEISSKMLIEGCDGNVNARRGEIFLKDSGTSMRFFAAVSNLGNGEFILTGSERLKERPIGHLVNALRVLGGDISCRDDRFPPVFVRAKGLKGGNIELDVSESSQYLSAILLVLPYAEKESIIHLTSSLSSRPYVDITIDMMKEFGAEVKWLDERTLAVNNFRRYVGKEYHVEGDCSSAAYFWAAAAILGIEVRTVNVNLGTRQGDIKFLDILEEMGCEVRRDTGGVTVIGSELKGVNVDMNLLPDQVPTLSVVAAFAEGITTIRNVSHLRIKESDRLSAVANELTRTGIKVVEKEDGLVIHGGKPKGARIDTYNDHRIAMSFAIMGLKVGGMKISNPLCVNKSFPDFWNLLECFYS